MSESLERCMSLVNASKVYVSPEQCYSLGQMLKSGDEQERDEETIDGQEDTALVSEFEIG